MPRVEEQDGYDDPENICREERHDKGKEELIRDNVGNLERMFGGLDLD